VGRLDDTIRKVLVNGLATRFCVEPKVAKKLLPEAVEQWGKLRRLNLNQGSLKMFVLRLFGKFVPFFPTLMGWRRFHSTHKVGPWTPLTSNPSNVLSAVLKTGENGGWLTAVARWHMRYLLRRISRRQHDRPSGLCAIPFAVRAARCLAAVVHGASSIVWYHCARVIVTHVEHSRACNSNNAFLPLTMPTFLNFLFPQDTSRIVHFGHGFMAHVVATHVYIWARPILVGVGAELLERAQAFAVGRAARCV
jgi:hypothetical protein